MSRFLLCELNIVLLMLVWASDINAQEYSFGKTSNYIREILGRVQNEYRAER